MSAATAHLFVPTRSGGKDPSRERIDLGLVSLDVQLWELFLCKPMSPAAIRRVSVKEAFHLRKRRKRLREWKSRRRTWRALRTALAETLDLSALSRMRSCSARTHQWVSRDDALDCCREDEIDSLGQLRLAV